DGEEDVEAGAEGSGRGWTLRGEKTHVLDGQCAEWCIVSARTSGAPRDAAGVTLFLVPRDAPGLEIERLYRVDARGAALLRLGGVRVGDDAILGAEGQGKAPRDRLLGRGRIRLRAVTVGGTRA